jgi:hypothetical protein
VVLLRQMPHAGGERLIERAIVSPFREHLVDGRVVDQGGPAGRSGHRHALPLHTRIEDPQDEIEDAVIATGETMSVDGDWHLMGGSGGLAKVKGGGKFTVQMTSPTDSEMKLSIRTRLRIVRPPALSNYCRPGWR